jgi:hypothetical protein
MPNITASNSVYMLAVPPLYTAPQQLQGFAADAAFDTGESEPAEIYIGVDGIVSAGFVPYLTDQTIHLQADSPSCTIFETWLESQKISQTIYFASATLNLISVGRKYSMSQGILRRMPATPGARKVLQPRDFVITWGDISPAVS